jgi:branched-chain amino acid transport system ATP-binding protein
LKLLLEIKDVSVSYDTAMVLNEANLGVDSGELVSLVGPNGAGKSTLLRTIAGLINWEREIAKGMRKELANITFQGSITFEGEKIDKLPPHEVAKKGLILCPERGRPFGELTVLENLKVGAHLCKSREEMEGNLDRVYELFPVLKERRKQISGTLSGGERAMLAIGRALMYRTKLLCIDEPSTGLAPRVKDDLFQRVKEIYALGITILLVEQDVSFAFELASRNYVLSRGKVIAEGTAEELLTNETIRKTYLGL